MHKETMCCVNTAECRTGFFRPSKARYAVQHAEDAGDTSKYMPKIPTDTGDAEGKMRCMNPGYLQNTQGNFISTCFSNRSSSSETISPIIVRSAPNRFSMPEIRADHTDTRVRNDSIYLRDG